MFASAAPLASTFAGALAYGITSGHSSLSNWRLLFLVEGLPTILLAPIAFFFIPDSPDHAKFLSVEEKAIAKSRAIRQTGTSERIGGLDLKQFVQTLYDVKAWCYAVCIGLPGFSNPFLSSVFAPTREELTVSEVHVFQRQRELRELARLPPNYLGQDGIQQYQRPGPFSSAILRRVSFRQYYDFYCGQDTAEGLGTDNHVRCRGYWLRYSCNSHHRRSPIVCRLLGSCRRFLHHSKHSGMDS